MVIWSSPKTSTDATNLEGGKKETKQKPNKQNQQQNAPHITAHLLDLHSALLTVV